MWSSHALAAVVAAAPVAAAANASTWEIDPVHTHAGFSVRHLMVSNVRGEFGAVAGTVEIDEADPAKSKVEATIDAGSIDTRDAKRDEHLRSADFLDVAKHPKITFKSTAVRKAGKGWKIVGDLTLHGVTREVVLATSGPTPEVKAPWGQIKRGLTATTRIRRKDFGVSWNQALDGGGVVLGEEVDITLEVELTKK